MSHLWKRACRRAEPRLLPHASVTVGPVTVGWLDYWTWRYGIDLEVTVGRRVYCMAVGFGRGVRFMRGVA